MKKMNEAQQEDYRILRDIDEQYYFLTGITLNDLVEILNNGYYVSFTPMENGKYMVEYSVYHPTNDHK